MFFNRFFLPCNQILEDLTHFSIPDSFFDLNKKNVWSDFFCLSHDFFLVFLGFLVLVFIHLPDEVKDCVALAVGEGVVESPDQLATSIGDRVDMEL